MPGGGGQFSGLLSAEVCASAVVMVVMLDTPCSEVECKTTGYPLHSHVSPSLPLPCVTVCHQVSTELYAGCLSLICCNLPTNWCKIMPRSAPILSSSKMAAISLHVWRLCVHKLIPGAS